MISDQSNELVLTESRTMRAQTADRVDVLDKVKALALLPDGTHATTDIVAGYYEVTSAAIEKVVQRHRSEVSENGYRVLRGADYRTFAADNLSTANPKTRTVALFTRRTILNVGQLLTESTVARQVRTYLLNVEEIATPAQRIEGMERAQLARERLSAMGVAKQFGLVNPSYVEAMARTELARMNGEEPDIDPADMTITCDEFLDGRVAQADLGSARTRLGKTVAALFRARYDGKDPQKIKRPIHGVHRDVAVYTHRDLDLFDTAWAEISRHYNVQDRINLGGAA
ncbi:MULTISPECIES: hypothetical protein [unclassified Streptomyces]|uniref:hypothetical protein n=1 Tax=unclassified Streptomyces TaxID=2593676 RepID=UPI00136D5C46|nr:MULTISPECIES: hypothetical protein [unclassified Streptomyces]MYY79681.1 hypothetical protein [Streptomyces sp. SID335]MYZ12845.1 hypothetical protein [Streptomyces sp. SID337]NDZ91149.1 hypothetical protein [Streptomyces sp. SID10115]NEA03713.1 hypothetical protein [Streptomyces sp. SID10116]